MARLRRLLLGSQTMGPGRPNLLRRFSLRGANGSTKTRLSVSSTKVFAIVLFVGLFAALVAKGKRLNVAMLVGLILLYLFAAVFYQFQIGGGPESGI